MANRNRSAEKEAFWRLVLDEHAGSGLNAREFCRRESLSEPSFYSWRRKIRQRDEDTCTLVPVKIVPDESPRRDPAKESSGEQASSIEVVAAGVVVRVNDTCSIDAMHRVLTAVQRLVKATSPC